MTDTCRAPLVTVGVPVRNCERYVAQAVESVLQQTHRNVEVIISDNRSTDRTVGVCEDVARTDDRVRLVSQPQNIGMIQNFKFVLEQAKGDYFMWLAADDTVNPCFIQQCLCGLHRGADFAIPSVTIIGANGECVSTDVMPYFRGANSPFEFASASIRGNNYVVYSLFRRVFLTHACPVLERDGNMSGYNEGRFVHYVCSEGNPVYVHQAVLGYRWHDTNASGVRPAYRQVLPHSRYILSSFLVFLGTKRFTASQRVLLACKLLISRAPILGRQCAAVFRQACRKIVFGHWMPMRKS
jgi:glycosyltransferase involved in cell wall biosynthesis